MKRVCMVRRGYYPAMQPNRRNAETLAAHGFEVDVICLKHKGQKSQETIKGVKVYRLPLRIRRGGFLRYAFEYTAFFLMAFSKLTWLFLRKRYKVIEVSGMPDFVVFTALVPKLMGAAVVLNLLDHTPEAFMEHFKVGPGNIIVKFLRLLEKASVRWPDYCFGTQIFNQRIMENHGVPASRISLVPNVPDENFAGYNTYSGNHKEGFCLITHGSLLEKYGVQTLIKAVTLLVKDIPDLKVTIVGGGESKPHLERLAQSLGVMKYVDFIGIVPQNEVPGYIARADIGIVTILTKTNPMLPNKLFEYMVLQKPIITASIPAITAYFDDSSVMYYEPGDENDLARCVLELYRDEAKRTALSASGSLAYQKFRWSVTKYDYLNVYEQLCSTRNSKKAPEAGLLSSRKSGCL